MRRLRSFVLLILLGAAWGLHVAFSKLLDAQGVREALAYLSIYMGITSGALLAAALIWGRSGWRWSALSVFMAAGAFAYFTPLLIELLAAPQIDATLFSMVEALEPAMATAFAAAVAIERATQRRVAAVALAICAAALLLLPEARLGATEVSPWLAAAFLAPASYSIANVYLVARWPEGMGVLAVSAGEATAGFVLSFVVALAAGVDGAMLIDAAATGGLPLWALTAASLITALVSVYLLKTESAVFVSFGGIISLATGVLAGVLIFGERPTLWLWAACALVAGSLWLLRGEEEVEEEPIASAHRHNSALQQSPLE